MARHLPTPASAGPRRFDPPDRRSLAVAAALTAVAVSGCGTAADIRPGDIRSYRVPRGRAAAPSAQVVADGRPQLSYDVPPGWTDRGGNAMRLATLLIGGQAEGHEVTVIPAAGTLEGNVARWQGQLEPDQDPAAATAAVAAAVAAAERVEADGRSATVVMLLDEAARSADASGAEGKDDGEAILAAMLPLPGEPEGGGAVFVKFKGPATVARREKERFVRFVGSLRLEGSGAGARPVRQPDEE
jgi:hypothetical protein